jgi:hypothetical protein
MGAIWAESDPNASNITAACDQKVFNGELLHSGMYATEQFHPGPIDYSWRDLPEKHLNSVAKDQRCWLILGQTHLRVRS